MDRFERAPFDGDGLEARIQIGCRLQTDLIVRKEADGLRGRREAGRHRGRIGLGSEPPQLLQPCGSQRITANRLDYPVEFEGPQGASVHRG